MTARNPAVAAVAYEDVLDAQQRLLGIARKTPVLRSVQLDHMVGGEVWLKAEHLQRAGSFKFRGAYNAAASLTAADRVAGLCTVSSGNHGQALALSGQLLSTKVVVFMPTDAPDSKVAATRRYGARIAHFDRYRQAQAEVSAALACPGGPIYISSHDDRHIIAGAATMTLELLQDVSGLDTVVMAVGGGGGLAGAGLVARRLIPGCRVVGVEPEASGVNRRSLLAGHPVEVTVPRTIADGQTLTSPGVLAFSIMLRVVDDVVSVSDQEIIKAMRFLQEHFGRLVEPSGAAGVAALLSGKVGGQRIGVIVSGGNIDEGWFGSLMERSG